MIYARMENGFGFARRGSGAWAGWTCVARAKTTKERRRDGTTERRKEDKTGVGSE
jgi:hypothetical protein